MMASVARARTLRWSAGALTVAAVVASTGFVAAQTTREGDTTSVGGLEGYSVSLASRSPTQVCPGPQTLTVPVGGSAQSPPGPVVVQAAFARPAMANTTLSEPAADGVIEPARIAAVVPGEQDAAPGARLLAAANWGVDGGVASATLTTAGPVRLDAPSAATATQLWYGRSGELRGLASVRCAATGADLWFVGGGSAVGQQTRLLLANPNAAAVAAEVQVLGPQGTIRAAAALDQVVPAGGQISVLLNALAPKADVVAVRVTARSGSVTASLFQQVLRGDIPAGVAGIGPVAPASTRVVIPGIIVANPSQAAITVVPPGTADAVVQVQLLGPNGAVDLPDAVVTARGGAVTQVPLSAQVRPGTYAAVVTSDVPVLASAWLQRGQTVTATPSLAASSSSATSPVPSGSSSVAARPSVVNPAQGATTDVEWPASAVPFTGTAWAGVPRVAVSGTSGGTAAAVTIVNDTDAAGSAVIRELNSAGKALSARPVTLPPHSSQQVWLLSESVAVNITSPSPVRAALLLVASDPRGPMMAVQPISGVAASAAATWRVVVDPAAGLG